MGRGRLKAGRERAGEFIAAGDYALELALQHNVLDQAKANEGKKFGERGVRQNNEERLARIRGHILAIQCRACSPITNFRGERIVIDGCFQGFTLEHPIMKRMLDEMKSRQSGKFISLEGIPDTKYLSLGEVDLPRADGGKAMIHIEEGNVVELVLIFSEGGDRQMIKLGPRYLSKDLAWQVLSLFAR